MSGHPSRYSGSEEAIRNLPWIKKLRTSTEPGTTEELNGVQSELSVTEHDEQQQNLNGKTTGEKDRGIGLHQTVGERATEQAPRLLKRGETNEDGSLAARYLALKALDGKMASDFLWHTLWHGGNEWMKDSDDPLDEILFDLGVRIRDYRLRSRRARDAARRKTLGHRRPRKKKH